MAKRGKKRKAPEKAAKKTNAPPLSRVWPGILLAALAAMVGVVLAALESVKEAALR